MARDPLPVLWRLRRIDLDAARRALADSLRAEAGSATRLAEVGQRIATETAALVEQPAERRPIDAFAAWRLGASQARQEAMAACRTDAARSDAARQALAGVRATTRVLEIMAEHHDERHRAEALRQQQLELDGRITGRRRRPLSWSG